MSARLICKHGVLLDRSCDQCDAEEDRAAVLDQMVADAEEDDLYAKTDKPAPPTR